MIKGYVTSAYDVTDAYKGILVSAQDATVRIEPSDDDRTRLVFLEKKRRPYEFFVQDGVLTVRSTKRKWYQLLKVGVDRSEIRLYVPRSMPEGISVKANVGNVAVCSIACGGAVDIQINTGKVNLETVSCKELDSKGNSGSVSLNNCTAKDRIFIKRNTGKVQLNDCSAPEIFVKTNTGKVCGKLPTNMAFVARTNTGKIQIPQSPIGEVIGGRCEIKTNTGNLKVE